MDRAGGDFHLAAGSPAVDNSDDAFVPRWEVDLDGNTRIVGAHADVGAYERGAALALPYTTGEAKKALRIAAGLDASTPTDVSRWNLERGGLSGTMIDMADVIAITRVAGGLDPLAR